MGTLLFIGILFTCAIPFYLRVNQANIYYEQVVGEMKVLDGMRGTEMLEVYAYPLSQTSKDLNIYIKNMCPIPVTLVAVWVNDDIETSILSNSTIPPSGEETYGPLTVSPVVGESFNIKVLTRRGNKFISLTNPLVYTEGGWSGCDLAINVVFKSLGHFHLIIKDSNMKVIEDSYVFRPPSSDVLKRVPISIPGTYSVEVTKLPNTPVPVYPSEVTVNLSEPSVWVYVQVA